MRPGWTRPVSPSGPSCDDRRRRGAEPRPGRGRTAARVRSGVSDRFEIIVGDAAGVDVGSGFATAQSSQFFISEVSRAGTLRILRSALSPGGIVEAPVMGDHASMARDPKGAEASDDTLKRVVHNLWGIPERTADLTRRRAAGGRASHWDNRRSTTALTCRCPVARTCR
jgi:hypothetical protein